MLRRQEGGEKWEKKTEEWSVRQWKDEERWTVESSEGSVRAEGREGKGM